MTTPPNPRVATLFEVGETMALAHGVLHAHVSSSIASRNSSTDSPPHMRIPIRTV